MLQPRSAAPLSLSQSLEEWMVHCHAQRIFIVPFKVQQWVFESTSFCVLLALRTLSTGLVYCNDCIQYTVLYTVYFIPCHAIVFMPLTNPRSPRAVHKMSYCPFSRLILHDIPRHLTFELYHVLQICKCTCKLIFSKFYSFLCVCTCISCVGQPSRDT